MLDPQLSPSVSSTQQLQSRGMRPAGRRRIVLRSNTVACMLLLSAIGPLYNNLALFRLANLGFTVDLSHLLLVLTALIVFFGTRRFNPRIVIVWIGFISLELTHAIIFRLLSEPEWIKSAAQIGVYSTAFVAITSLRLKQRDFIQMGAFAIKLAFLFGGFAILQFVLMNGYDVDLSLPNEWRSMTLSDPSIDNRYQDVVRAVGISREPAELSQGLAILISFIVFLRANGLKKGRKVNIAIIIALGGIVVTLSPTGFITVFAIFVSILLITPATKLVKRFWIIIFIIILLGFVAFMSDSSSDRLRNIVSGTDISTSIRVTAPIKILFDLPHETEIFLLGTGLGLERRQFQTYLKIYQPLVTWKLIDLRIHNILAVVKFQQGILGLLLYLILIWVILRPFSRSKDLMKFKNFASIFALLIMFFFSSGYYSSPVHWSLLAFVSVLRTSNWQLIQKSEANLENVLNDPIK